MKRNEVILALKNYALGPEKGLDRKVAIEAIRLLDGEWSSQKESKKKLPCICGCKRRELWYSIQGKFFKCVKCGKESKPGKTEMEAIRNWNKMIDEESIQK